jgi:hypothetical protein
MLSNEEWAKLNDVSLGYSHGRSKEKIKSYSPTILEERFIKKTKPDSTIVNKVFAARFTKKLKVLGLTGQYEDYIPFLRKYSPVELLCDREQDREPDYLILSYYSFAVFCFNQNSLNITSVHYNALIILINPLNPEQRLYNSVTCENKEVAVRIAFDLLSFYNSKHIRQVFINRV